MKEVFFITLKFPPSSDIGAKRPLRMVRRLPRHGWKPYVFTNPEGNAQPDPALMQLVPPDIEVDRRYSRGPYFRLVDGMKAAWARDVGRDIGTPQKVSTAPETRLTRLRRRVIYRAENVAQAMNVTDEWWPFLPDAFLTAYRAMRERDFRAIYVCGDPNSPYIMGHALSRATGLPLVIDMRDPWTLDPTIRALKYPHTRYIETKLESRVFGRASAIILNTRRAREAYERHYPWLDPGKLHVIHNAFDPELVDDVHPDPAPVFTIAHFGHYHRLRSARVFLTGLELFMKASGLGPGGVRFVNYGEFIPDDLAFARSKGLGDVVDLLPPIAFRDSPRALRSAHVLLVEQRNALAVQVPGKFYDYLFAERPVLSLSVNPELVSMIESTRCGVNVDPEDPQAVASALARLHATDLASFRAGLDRDAMVPYSGEDTARRLAAILDAVGS